MDRRELFIGELTALAPLIVHVGGQAAIGDLFLAYRDVLNWWRRFHEGRRRVQQTGYGFNDVFRGEGALPDHGHGNLS